ncbi:MAG: hypothetical protein U9Q22_07505 [Candidatus Altiarchaeota archaeon]|nr:hypothetical protein [Candidatus Altiarchaeota archaeon]
MSVMNFRVKKLSGERKDIEKKEISNVDVSSNFVITSMRKKRDDRVGDYLLVNFRFNVQYKPDIGRIDVEGYLWYTSPDLGEVVVEKEGKLEVQSDALKEISTTILRDSILEAIDISRKLGLPVPVNLPKVTVKPKEVSFPKAT